MLDSKVLNTDYDLAEMKDLCLPNLLDNADFKSGIINQRMKTSYSASNTLTYSVDRWRFYNGNVTVASDNVKFENTSSSVHLAIEQVLDGLKSDTYTAYVNIKSLSGSPKMRLLTDGDSLIDEVDLQVGDNILTCTGKPIKFQIELAQGSVEFYQAKLEKGSVYTGMPQWDYVDELLNCQRYFYPLGGGWIGMFPARSDETSHTIYIQTPVIMRTIPSLIVKDGSDISSAKAYLNGNRNPTQVTQIACSSFTVSEINIFVALTAPVGSTDQIGYGFAIFQKAMALDAEIY